MNPKTTITLVRCAILLAAMGCGVVGYRWYQNEPEDIALDILDYAGDLTRSVDASLAMEARLIAEGREEETFRAFDVRRNAELEWRDIQGELYKFAGAANQRRLVAHNILTDPDVLRTDLEEVRRQLISRVPAYSMLGLSMALLVGTLFIRPARIDAKLKPKLA